MYYIVFVVTVTLITVALLQRCCRGILHSWSRKFIMGVRVKKAVYS